VLTFVVVRFGDSVGISDTLQGALDQVFSGDAGATTNENAPPTSTPSTTTPSTTTPSTTTPSTTTPTTANQVEVKAALTEAQQAFVEADKALAAGDLAGYQKANETAQAAVVRAVKAMGG
jgi:uncharacterized membrane protein (UPF0182 family)